MQIKKDTPRTSSQGMRLHLKSYVTFVTPDKALLSSTQMAKDFLHICTIFMSVPDYFTYFFPKLMCQGVKKVNGAPQYMLSSGATVKIPFKNAMDMTL